MGDTMENFKDKNQKKLSFRASELGRRTGRKEGQECLIWDRGFNRRWSVYNECSFPLDPAETGFAETVLKCNEKFIY